MKKKTEINWIELYAYQFFFNSGDVHTLSGSLINKMKKNVKKNKLEIISSSSKFQQKFVFTTFYLKMIRLKAKRYINERLAKVIWK